MSAQIGATLTDRYLIKDLLGSGVLIKTFSAIRLADQQAVIVKELSFRQLPNWQSYDLFQREIKVLKNLNHPAIPRCLDDFEINSSDDHCFYLVMERVPGMSLDQKLSQGWRMNETGARDMAQQLLAVLDYLHNFSPPVIHRDIKPSNLILEQAKLYLIDFGGVQDSLNPQGGSTMVGTFGYMAPEQVMGKSLPASDLYALGATLIHVLSGKAPAELPQKELQLEFQDYIHVSNEFKSWLERLVKPASEHRFQSARDALQALLYPAQTQPQPPSESFLPEKILKPSGTRIQLRRQGQQLQICLPAGQFNQQMRSMTVFTIFWLSFITFWTSMALRGSFFFACFSIPFWIVGLVMAQQLTKNVLMTTYLEFDSQIYQLRWRLGQFFETKQMGATKSLISLRQHLRYRLNNQPVYALGLETGSKTYYFGQQLTDSERLWLQSEISTYLSEQLPAAQAKSFLKLSQRQIDNIRF